MFRVIDKIVGETVEFDDKFDAEIVATHRLSMHRDGYIYHGKQVPPRSNAIILVKGSDYILCLR